MFSLLLNIYAKWHPEMFNPYLHGSPGTQGLEGSREEARDQSRKVPSLQSPHLPPPDSPASAVFCFRVAGLAIGFGPREKNMPPLLQKVCTRATHAVYIPTAAPRDFHKGRKIREVVRGAGLR